MVGRPVANESFLPLDVGYWRSEVLPRALPNGVVAAVGLAAVALLLIWCVGACGPMERGEEGLTPRAGFV